MASIKPKTALALAYEEAAQAYLRSLPLEHFMEATAQATQRKITLESLDLVKVRRADVHVFNELLVQYPRPGQKKFGQVVPDNMVVVSDQPIQAESSYNLPLEPAPPLWTLEYVSRHNKRKDYEESFTKYEQELQVPYYLVFYPDDQEVSLYRLRGKKYVSVKANKHGRYAIGPLELEVALLDGWVRYWYRGELLPLPAELQRDLDEARQRAEAEKRRADAEKRRADTEAHRADTEAHRADTEAHRADTEARRAETEARRVDELQRRLAEAERRLAEGGPPPPPSTARRTHGPKPTRGRGGPR